MHRHTTGAIRIRAARIEFSIPSDDGRVVDIGLDITERTSHALRHLLAAHVDPRSGRPLRCRRPTVLERALQVAGGAIERVEVLPGEPPRFVLAVVTPRGTLQRLDLDLLDTAELVVTRCVDVVAVGWPQRDWDDGLRQLLA